MVAPDGELTRQSSEQPAATCSDQRGLAVDGHVEDGERAAEILDDPLQAEANAEYGQTAPNNQIEGLGHREIRRPARSGREHDEILTAASLQRLAGQIRAHRDDLGACRANVVGQGVYKRVFVVD